jgi:hypothetical protein
MYIIFVGIMLVFQQSCCAGDIEDLVQMRQAQVTADYVEYHAYEKKINTYKERHAVASTGRRPLWDAGIALLHAFPWIVWQVLFLVLLYALMILVLYRVPWKYICCMLLCVTVTGSIVGYGYYERYRRIGFISESNVPMYLRPDAQAVRSCISYGDEVHVYSTYNDYVLISCKDKKGWVAWHMVQEV